MQSKPIQTCFELIVYAIAPRKITVSGLVGAHRQDLDGVVSVAVTSSRYHKPFF